MTIFSQDAVEKLEAEPTRDERELWGEHVSNRSNNHRGIYRGGAIQKGVHRFW